MVTQCLWEMCGIGGWRHSASEEVWTMHAQTAGDGGATPPEEVRIVHVLTVEYGGAVPP